MTVKPRPDGYHSVTPSLIVRDAAKAIEFYARAFGAVEVSRMADTNGKIMHAEIRIGDSIVMLGDENEEWGVRSPLSTNGISSSLHVYVDDVDRAFARAVEAGATVRYPLEDAFWGDRYGKVTDPFGHEWGLATHVKDMTEAEIIRAAGEWMSQQAAEGASA